jgi:outer membrane protein TolC
MKIKKNILTKAMVVASLAVMTAMPTVFAKTVNLDLNQVVEMALRNDPSIKISEATVEQYKEAKTAAKAAQLLSISLSSTASRTEYNDNSTSNLDAFTNTATASIPIYSGGRIDGNIEVANQELKAYQHDLQATLQSTKLTATSDYYNVLEAKNNVEVLKESVARLQEHLKNTKTQYDVGVVAKTDVLRSEVELADAQQSLISAENTYAVAVSTLNNLIGLDLNTELNLMGELKYSKDNRTLEESLEYALKNHPSIHEAEAGVKAAKAAVTTQNAAYMPQVNASFSDTRYQGNSDSTYWTAAVTATWNVFDSGIVAAKIREARAAQLEAIHTLKQTKDSVAIAVKTAYLNIRSAERRIPTTKIALEQAKEDYRIAQVSYNAGVATNTDVMDAQVSLTSANTNYIAALYDYNVALASLDSAMGLSVEKPGIEVKVNK